jgi:Flp pilus assembly protein TadG
MLGHKLKAQTPKREVASVRNPHQLRGRSGDERGSALVEFALIAPIVFLILFGIIEFGFIFKDSLTLTYMTRAGSRTGADAGNATNPSADYQILSAIKSASGALSSQVQGVIIFKATGNSPTLPMGCSLASTGVVGECNVYSAADFSQVASSWASQNQNDFGCGATAWDTDWCPSTRVVSASGNGGSGPDYLGIYISAHHSNITGFFHSMTLTDTSVIRLEPQTP